MDTLDTIIRDRTGAALPDLLLAIYDYAYCRGAGIIPPAPDRVGMPDVLATIESIHRIEVLRPRGWDDTPPTDPDNLPDWLPAHCERETLPQGRPDDWIRRMGSDGRP